jgi:hypothetical protein
MERGLSTILKHVTLNERHVRAFMHMKNVKSDQENNFSDLAVIVPLKMSTILSWQSLYNCGVGQ